MGKQLEILPPFLLFQSNVAASNAKLALFYDWLFFNPDKDSIMNIGMGGHLFSLPFVPWGVGSPLL